MMLLKRLLNEEGQGLTEYSILIAFIVIALIVTLSLFSDEVIKFWEMAVDRFSNI